MFKNIMLAIDGSKYTDGVLKHGIDMAKTFKSTLSVITVLDIRIFEWAASIGTDGFIPIVPSSAYETESRKLLEEKCDKVIEKAHQILAENNIQFKAEKLVGSPMDVIVEKSMLSDLLIVGKRGEFERWDNKALGATVESISRNIEKPLLVTKQKYHTIDSICVAYDGSLHANKALQYVGHLAESFHAKVNVILVSEDKDLGTYLLSEADNYLMNYAITIQSELLSGHPDKSIVAYAKDHDVDLLAIGAYGKSKIKETILGSTTEHILRMSTCPVLLAK